MELRKWLLQQPQRIEAGLNSLIEEEESAPRKGTPSKNPNSGHEE